VTRPLYVAAGGGGDALASLIVRHALDPAGAPPVVLSYSWDRYIIDPAPGPRSPRDFADLRQLTGACWEVTAASRLLAGGVSGLALLARHTRARFVLMDPAGGAVGMRRQLCELIDLLAADSVMLVDVGGDVVAHGDEPTLLSPLGDSLALAALAELPVPTSAAVVGLGLDGELPEDDVRADLAAAGADSVTLGPEQVEPYVSALEYHPSEATMLVAAAATRVTGRAEIRDKGALVRLTPASAEAYVLPAARLLGLNRIARGLASTRSFAEAEAVTVALCGRTELDHERRKAHALDCGRPAQPPAAELRERFGEYRRTAVARGVDFVSFRRLTEILGMRRYQPPALRQLIGDSALRHLPLCRLG
jgi:hypothetical protein